MPKTLFPSSPDKLTRAEQFTGRDQSPPADRESWVTAKRLLLAWAPLHRLPPHVSLGRAGTRPLPSPCPGTKGSRAGSPCLPLSHGMRHAAAATAGTAPHPALSADPSGDSHRGHHRRYSPCRRVPRDPGRCRPHRPGMAQLLPAARKVAGAETPAGAAGCPLAPPPRRGCAGPAARCCSAGCGRPPAPATRPACHPRGLTGEGLSTTSSPPAPLELLPVSVAACSRGEWQPARSHGLSGARVHGAGPSCAQQLSGTAVRGGLAARESHRAGAAPSGCHCWGCQGSCLPLLWCQPVRGTAAGPVPPAELPRLARGAAHALPPQHNRHGTARRQTGSLGLRGDLQPMPRKAIQEMPCQCPMSPSSQQGRLQGDPSAHQPLPTSPPQGWH